MNFANIYIKAKDAVDRALRSLWAANAGNESQEAMGKAIREITKSIFASDESMPVVQCMNSYESVHSVSGTDAEALVYPLWDKISPQGDKHYHPYEHQYQSWNALLNGSYKGKPMSICVTTGTGSGKTECFMIPLVKDLIDYEAQSLKREESVKAIFLYPLNALMEDQKERLENLLKGTNLTYTVYNGDLPEREPKATDSTEDAEKIRKKIDDIRGLIVDENGKPVLDKFGDKQYRFPKILYTRGMVRNNPPDIVLTNPTMLEYILLRKKDESLINPKLKSLRWIAIDETHSYTGAGAAELAMLLRRVMLAFDTDCSNVRFATSSATFGNAKTEEEKKIAKAQLKEFISGITGLDKNQIEIIDGKRVGNIPEGEDRERWEMIFNDEYVPLNKLFPQDTVEEKLMALDEMCARLGDSLAMKIKVHYFFRVPNNGLYVRLDEHNNGAFKIYTKNEGGDTSVQGSPMLELSRCRTCGEYVAIAKVNPKTGEYSAPQPDDSDMFDLVEEAEDSTIKTAVIGLSNHISTDVEDIQPYYMDKAHGVNLKRGISPKGGWQLVANTRYRCPYCGNKQTRTANNDSDTQLADPNEMKMTRFRVSADFISRIIAPVILNELEKYTPDADNHEVILHDGQQYLSFADSRQMAAKSTLNQNLQEERLWFHTTIFHELCARKDRKTDVMVKVKELQRKRDRASDNDDDDEYDRLNAEIKKLKRSVKETITWMEIVDLFKNKENIQMTRVFCEQFLKKDENSDELDVKGRIPERILDNYIHSIMVMYLAGHPSIAAAPETMGLFHPVYDKLKVRELPSEVEAFNNELTDINLRIDENDWQDLLRYVIDYNVRSNQAVYLYISEDKPINIKSTNRFMAEKPRRRPAHKPVMEVGKPSDSRIVRYLADLYARDKGITTNNEAQAQAFHLIKPMIEALWTILSEGGNAILTHGRTWDKEKGCHVLDTDKDGSGARRMNLLEMSFKLFDEAWLCDVNSEKNPRHTVALRPIAYSFKNYSPFLNGTEPMLLDESLHETWEVYPYYSGSGKVVDNEILEQWASEKRNLLWNNGIWGKEGIFADRLRQIYLTPNLFIQAEHTAQVDKSVGRRRQQSFKNHGVNILACSTTMEMGVDLGSLELVMLSSVPPMPANYKQRAGRSGRNNRVKSACVTLCTSDTIGLRTYYNPIDNIIERPVEVPQIDLQSPQVIPRHINSFLIRYFNVFGKGNINQRVADFYTPFEVKGKHGYYKVFDPLTNLDVQANRELGDENNTNYHKYNEKLQKEKENPSTELLGLLEKLLSGTFYEKTRIETLLDMSREDNERCYQELSAKAQDLKFALENAGGRQKYIDLLNIKYVELLNERLLTYWSTNRFTPNANMPVNVLQLDLSAVGKRDTTKTSSSSNPSYSLREAIAQYVPGNSVVVDGVVYVVRGVMTSNMYERVRSFKKIYKTAEKTEISDGPSLLSGQIKWTVNDDYALELVRPIGFLPDVNESNTRVVDTNVFTQVRAQLIGANTWDNDQSEHLYSLRDNLESGDSKILYYNEGIGYGFAYCTRCGRTIIENEVAASSAHPEIPPFEMNPIKPSDPEKPAYHRGMTGKQAGAICSSRSDYKLIHRNVILGDVIQTDYCEIRIRHKNMSSWMNERNSEFELLTTLGIALTQALADILGKDRHAVDFALTPNGHICIFDTNPGGAGYSNQLRRTDGLMRKVIVKARQILAEAKAKHSKDMLLDKFTLRYLRYIDIDAALNWLDEEESFSN